MVATTSSFTSLLIMKKREFAVFIILSFLLMLALSSYCKRGSMIQKEESLMDLKNNIDSMKIRDLIILAKYAQGGVVFNSFLEHVRHMKEDERKDFLSQIVELIRKLEPQESDAATAIKKSELSADCKQSLILSEGVTDQNLEKLLKLQDEDLEDTFKLLLNVFAEGYKRAYARNRNNASKFWYWDYSIPATSFQIVELDTKQEVDISNF